MERYRTAAGDDFIIFNGSDEQFLGGRLMGANAGIGGTYGTMPELFVALNNMIDNNEIEKAKALQFKINDVDAGQPRSPFLPVYDTEKVKLIADKIERYVGELDER